MGETEDEFERAEALLREMEAREDQLNVNLQPQTLEHLTEEDQDEDLETEDANQFNIKDLEVLDSSTKNDEKEDQKKLLYSIENIAEGVYPGNSFLFNDQNKEVFQSFAARNPFEDSPLLNKHYLMIRFPDITISNTKSMKHNIKGLYVLIAFGVSPEEKEKNLNMHGIIYGLRSQQTSQEYSSGYRHSHLSSRRTYNFTNFCLGGSSSIGLAIADLSVNFTVERFELFLYELSAYVRHESLEGGPYIRIEQITHNESMTRARPVNLKEEYNNYLKRVTENNLDMPIRIFKIDNEERYVLNEKDENFLRYLGEHTEDKFVKNRTGGYSRFQEDPASLSDETKRGLKQKMFRFKGEIVEFEVIDEITSEEKIEIPKYPNPTLVNYIKKDLEKELNYYFTLKQSYELN